MALHWSAALWTLHVDLVLVLAGMTWWCGLARLPPPCLVVAWLGGEAMRAMRDCLVDRWAVATAQLMACLAVAWLGGKAVWIHHDRAVPMPVVDLWAVATSS